MNTLSALTPQILRRHLQAALLALLCLFVGQNFSIADTGKDYLHTLEAIFDSYTPGDPRDKLDLAIQQTHHREITTFKKQRPHFSKWFFHYYAVDIQNSVKRNKKSIAEKMTSTAEQKRELLYEEDGSVRQLAEIYALQDARVTFKKEFPTTSWGELPPKELR